MYPGCDMCDTQGTLFWGTDSLLLGTYNRFYNPGGAWGRPGTSLAIAESICDVSGQVSDLYEPIYTSGRQPAAGRPRRIPWETMKSLRP